MNLKKIILGCCMLFILMGIAGCNFSSTTKDEEKVENQTEKNKNTEIISETQNTDTTENSSEVEKYNFNNDMIHHSMTTDFNHYFSYNGKILPDYISSTSQDSYTKINLNNGKMLFEVGGELYLISENGIEEIDYNVNQFELSVMENKIVYLTKDENVILFDIATNEKKKICKINGNIFAISPDGNSFAYSDNNIAYVYTNGNVVEVGKNSQIINISNSAEYIYYFKNDSCYLMTGSEEHKQITKNINVNFIFNENHTELVFYEDGYMYIVENGNKQQILNSPLNTGGIDLVVPEYTIKHSKSLIEKTFEEWDNELGIYVYWSPSVITYATKDLLEKFYIEGASLFFIDKDKNLQLITDKVNQEKISKDGSCLFYSKNNSLYKVEKNDFTNPIILAENVKFFYITSNSKEIYYVDTSMVLWYKKETENPKKISENISIYAGIYTTYDDYVIFITDYNSSNANGKLYYSKNGIDKELITDNVCKIIVENGATYYYKNYNHEKRSVELYRTVDTMNFDLLLDDVRYYDSGFGW